MKYAWIITIVSAILIVMVLMLQPKFLDFGAERELQNLSENFVPQFDPSAPRSIENCISVDDIELTFNQWIGFAFNIFSKEFQESLGVIILKIHRCHADSTDGISFPLDSNIIRSHFHPISVGAKQLTRSIDNEIDTSARAVFWAAEFLKKHESSRIEEQLRLTCKLFIYRQINNFGDICARFR